MRAVPVKRLLLLILLAVGLGACASDPRYKQGLEWVLSNEQDKKRLEAQGFPQYNWY